MLISRLAPTPSGYLHLGNGLNFILTWLMVRQHHGRLKLRIDDADASRSRPEYIEDIFRQLDWLGLDWDLGPTGPDDFSAHHSQLHRRERYRTLLDCLAQRHILFFCTCSRRRIKEISDSHLYPGTCRRCRQVPPEPHTIRVRVPDNWFYPAADRELPLAPALGRERRAGDQPLAPLPSLPPVALAAEMGDFILWRRDDLPAYQLFSLADDLDDQVNLVVRGRDLLPSTAAQYFLAQQLGPAGTSFLSADFLHHPLLTNEQGDKLAKSDQALSLAAMRHKGITAGDIYRHTAGFLGLSTAGINSLADLQAASAFMTQRRSWDAPGPKAGH